MNPLVVDIEANELLENADTIWCIVAKELGIDEWSYYANTDLDTLQLIQGYKSVAEYRSLSQFFVFLSQAPFLIFHNGYGYDRALTLKLYPDWQAPHIEDTFILSSLFEPDRPGGHSLEQWGKDLGLWKQEHEDWSRFSIEMLQRCFRDVEITEKVWLPLKKERDSWDWEEAIRIEYTVAKLCAQMQLNGVLLDQEKAREVLSQINNELDAIDKELQELIPWQVTNKSESGAKMPEVKKPFKKDGSYTAQVLGWFND